MGASPWAGRTLRQDPSAGTDHPRASAETGHPRAQTLRYLRGIESGVTTAGRSVEPVQRDGWRFDIGGHRFFAKVGAVRDL